MRIFDFRLILVCIRISGTTSQNNVRRIKWEYFEHTRCDGNFYHLYSSCRLTQPPPCSAARVFCAHFIHPDSRDSRSLQKHINLVWWKWFSAVPHSAHIFLLIQLMSSPAFSHSFSRHHTLAQKKSRESPASRWACHASFFFQRIKWARQQHTIPPSNISVCFASLLNVGNVHFFPLSVCSRRSSSCFTQLPGSSITSQTWKAKKNFFRRFPSYGCHFTHSRSFLQMIKKQFYIRHFIRFSLLFFRVFFLHPMQHRRVE